MLVQQNVRSLIESKKTILAAKNVSILHCEIDDFDEIVQQYEQGNGLFDLLEQLQSVLDVLCEKFGLTRIEQVGNQFTIVGGLKLNENNIEQRLLTTHPSVRVVDFAFVLQDFARSKVLKNDKKLAIKFGINEGPIVSAVIGEFKPQYSIFGETLNVAKEVCQRSNYGKIMLTAGVQKTLN